MARRLALIIGNSVYRDSTLARLMTPDVDVGALAEILLDPELGAFEDANVLINMTSATVRRAISDFFAKKTREDLLLLYFSGHGVLDESGRLHLAVKDTDHNLLRGTAISASFITDEMDNSRSQRQVLILDCCHSGAFARGSKGAPGSTVGTASAFEGTGFGRVVLTATDATQYAWEGERIIGEAESSLFTHYMVQGLQSGAADINQDGQVTVDELYDYVYGEVVRQTPTQTPGKWSYKEQGEIVIARATQRQQPLPVVEKKQGPRIDEELEQRLEHLYTRGLSAYWLEDWDRAARSFLEIAEIQPDYRDTATKLAEARRQLDLKESYEKALTALQAGEFQQAFSALEAVVTAAPGYKDAAIQLEAARKQYQMADLYAEARQLHQARQWQAVINVFDRMTALDPAYADPEELLSSAQREFEVQKRRTEIERQYRQALQAMDAEQWQPARQFFVQIQEAEPGFEDAERLLARVEAEIARLEASRRTQEHVGVLYEQALSLARARHWRQALEKIEEIQALDPQFPDHEGLAARLQAELSQEEQETQRRNELATLYAEAVRLINAGEYQAALEKWGEVKAIKPDYYDHHKVQTTARKKLGVRTQPVILRIGRSTWAKVLLGGAILAGVAAGLFMLNRGPVWEIVFSSNRDGNWEIYKMRPDGTGLRPLSNNPADDRQPSTSPDGKIIFVSNREGNSEIYVMNADGGQQNNLTNHPANDYEPAWSPDGQRIAFVSFCREGGDECAGDVYVMNVDGRNLQNLTNHPAANDFEPAWSPDGKHIAFVSNREELHKIFVVDADGENLRPLIDQPFEQFGPCWSPDGRVTFGSPQEDKVYIVQKDGTGLEHFVEGWPVCWFRWSPDRRWIIWDDFGPSVSNWEVYLTNGRTGETDNLTKNRAEDRSPSWLP